MSAQAFEPARNGLMLTELRLPTMGRLWEEFAQRSDKEGVLVKLFRTRR